MIYKILAVIILLLFYGCYFLKMLLQKRKGIQTDQIGKGTFVFICSVITMKDSWRAGVSETDKTELVTSGIYQISRNPAFLGFDMVYIGILCMFFNWILFVVSVFTMVMFHLQIVNVEEEFLIKAFGEEYLKYRAKVNRYLGRKR